MRFFALTLIFVLVSACAAKPPWEKVDKNQQLEAYTNKGQGYLNLGETEKALQDFRKALAIKNNHPPALHGTALALEEQGELVLAEEFFKRALKNNAQPSQVRFDFAGFYYRQQKFSQAQKQLHLASQDIYYPNRGLVFTNLGYVYIKLNQPAEAINSFNQAIRLRTQISLAHNELLKLYVEQKNWQQAEQHWLTLKRFNSYLEASLPLALQAVTHTNNQQEIEFIKHLLSTQKH